MKYSINIEKNNMANNTGRETEKWEDVVNLLKNGLTFDTRKVRIFKYSSDEKLVAQKDVTMGNIFEVANSASDEILNRR